MVSQQLEARGIKDRAVLRAMREIPRELFVPKEKRFQAYNDGPLTIGQGQTISQPYIVALMTQLLKLKGQEKVLEIGTGSGYQAAILAKLAKKVYTIERHPSLLKKAKAVFRSLGLKNIETRCTDGAKGWPEKATFEAIMVTAAALTVPQALIDQLADPGFLVAPVGSGVYQKLLRLKKKNGKLVKEDFGGCVFVPLVETK